MFAPVSAAPVTIRAESKSAGLTAVVVRFEHRVAAVMVQVVLVGEPLTTTVQATDTVLALEVQIIPTMLLACGKGMPVPSVEV